MSLLRIIFVLVLCVQLRAQEISIHNQNFRGVKSMSVYYAVSDSTHKIKQEKTLTTTYSFDEHGNLLRRTDYYNSQEQSKLKCRYDSLDRIIERQWTTKVNGTEIRTYTYEVDSTGEFTIRKEYSNGVLSGTQSSYWDDASRHFIVNTWFGAETNRPADDQDEFDKNHKLVFSSSYNGFTEYGYDSLGNMNYMLMRAFEDGQCSMYHRITYTNRYSHGRLAYFSTPSRETWFTYNDKGFITCEQYHSGYNKETTSITAEYQYY